MSNNIYKCKNKKPELLSPAGNFECLKAAVYGGADAVYLSGVRFGARAFAGNFDDKMLLSAIEYAHLRECRVYLTVNTLLKQNELDEIPAYLEPLYLSGIDGIIMQDFGAMHYVHELFPDLPIHVSTQASVTSSESALFYKRLGACRIVPARELGLEEIRSLKQESLMEIECFVHGAMCYCYSGQCLLSSMIGGRSGNRGQCAQPCRLPYGLGGSKPETLMSLKDLCAIDHLPDLIDASVDSFKIEGRMKQPDYVYTVTSMYRKYIDLYLSGGRRDYKVDREDRKTLLGAYTRRGYSGGYYEHYNDPSMISFSAMDEKQDTSDETQWDFKLSVSAVLVLRVGKKAVLNLSYHRGGQTMDVSAEGLEVQAAKDRPVTEERVLRQINKTGTSDFYIRDIRFDMDPSVFVPISALNELRRKALDAMRDKILRIYRREQPDRSIDPVLNSHTRKNIKESAMAENSTKKAPIIVSVSTKKQLYKASRENKVSMIIVDDELSLDPEVSDFLKRHKAEQTAEYYLALPHIFRKSDLPYYERLFSEIISHFDGILIRNWDSFVWIQRKGFHLPVIYDSNLYVFNRRAGDVAAGLGISNYTYPLELNKNELKSLEDGGILPVYGYQTVMVTANCVKKTMGKCDSMSRTEYLKDRKNKKFMVKQCCKCCYNKIYNSDPLFLLDKLDEMWFISPGGIRLDFTCEDADTVASVLQMMEDYPATDYTRGHYNRGVK